MVSAIRLAQFIAGGVILSACGTSATPPGDSLFSDAGGNGSSDGSTKGGGNNPKGGGGSSGDGGIKISPTGPSDGSSGGVVYEPDGGIVCPTGLTCDVACSAGGTTTVTGKVYDPAGLNGLYNVAVYVPASPLQPLPKGVLTGSDSCSCAPLFASGALTNTTTAADGTFTLSNVPVGTDVPIVIQVGKWRTQVTIPVTSCTTNTPPDQTFKFLGTVPASDTIDSMPDIAISTGSADTLECLLTRIGVSPSEYVAGNSTAGHVHMFSGGSGGGKSGGTGTGTGSGRSESPGFTGAPAAYSSLWDSQADLMPYDVVMLSCEGGETYNDQPQNLEDYLNAGGRAFGSHFHYAWFAGPNSSGGSFGGGGSADPAPPSDWGANLANWFPGTTLGGGGLSTGDSTVVVQTLTGSTAAFPKGVALDQWLGDVGALGTEGASPGDVEVFGNKGDVGTTVKAQAWLTDSTDTSVMSFDTPVNQPDQPDGGPPLYCGRAVFSDLHVGGDPNFAKDTGSPPSGCASHALSPQEKVLEFIFFDLSSCVVPDTVQPPVVIPTPPSTPQ